MEREFDAYKLSRSMYPSIFNSFSVIRTASVKKSPQPTFLFPLETPLRLYAICRTIQFCNCGLQYGWKDNSMLAKPLVASTYQSSIVSGVIRCLSQCVSPKIAIFTTFLFPWGRPWGNHAKCCMDGKRIQCL